jgi:DNA adenine methylase
LDNGAAVSTFAKPVVAAKPFVKWVGGKRSILAELRGRTPGTWKTYHEPFVGGGALFFSLSPSTAVLSDINARLVLTYQAIRDDVDGLLALLEEHARHHSQAYFGRARSRLSHETDATAVAALFIYLNKTCFNGLYRVNASGHFNVPMGDYAAPPIVDEENLRAVSNVLSGVTILQQTFSDIKPRAGDFYYLDPPYHQTYNGYDGSGFGDEGQEALAEWCRKIDDSDGYFMESNSDTPLIRQLYRGFVIETVSAKRSVSCKGTQRRREQELIIRNYGSR